MADQAKELEKTKGVANVEVRRRWDKEEYRRKALEREERRHQPAVKRKFEKDETGVLTSVPMLKGRTDKAVTRSIEKDVGKSYMVNPEGDGAEKGGYYCKHCDRSYMDSTSYLDHLNSRMHQAAIGSSMMVKKSTEEEVKSRFKLHITKKLEAVNNGKDDSNSAQKYSFAERVKKLEEEELEIKERQREAKKRKKEAKEQMKKEAENAFTDEEAMAAMGFGSFGAKK